MAASGGDNWAILKSMVYLILSLPCWDACITLAEGLSGMVSECAEAGSDKDTALKVSFVTELHFSSGVGRDPVTGSPLVGVLVAQSSSPLSLLLPNIKVSEFSPECIAQYRQWLADIEGEGMVNGRCVYEVRRECSHLLRTLWVSVMRTDAALPFSVASSLEDSFRRLAIAGGPDQSCRLDCEALLFCLSSLLEVSSERLSLDDDEDVDEENPDHQKVAPLGKDDHALVSMYRDITERITAFLLTFCGEGLSESTGISYGVPPEILLQFTMMWTTVPSIIKVFESNCCEERQVQLLSSTLKILRIALCLYPRPTLLALEEICVKCSRSSSYLAGSVASWLLSFADTMEGLEGQRLSQQFFYVCGLFVRKIGNSNPGDEKIAGMKREAVSCCTIHALRPVEGVVALAGGQCAALSRVDICVQHKEALSCGVLRLRGILKALLNDSVFLEFAPAVRNALFGAADLLTEAYVWARGRATSGGSSGAGVDVYLDTGHCHHGDGSSSGSGVVAQLGEMHDVTVATLSTFHDCVPPCDDADLYTQQSVERTMKLIENMASSKLIGLTTVLVRWSTTEGQDNSDDSSFAPLCRLCSQCIHLTTIKASDPLLAVDDCAWLMEEISACAKLSRQVLITNASLLFAIGCYAVDPESSILSQLLKMVTALTRRGEMSLDIATLKLLASFFSRLCEMTNEDFTPAYISQMRSLIVNLVSGIFYGSLSTRRKEWAEMFHFLLLCVCGGASNNACLRDSIIEIFQQVFSSSLCVGTCSKRTSSDMAQSGYIVVVVNEKKGRGYSVVSVGDAVDRVVEVFGHSFNPRMKRSTITIFENLFSIFGIS